MTVLEIADLTKKTDRTVRNWINALTEKYSVIKEKISVSSPMKPADFNQEEVLVIINQGLGKTAADLYRMATKENQQAKNMETVQVFLDKILEKLDKKPATLAIEGKKIKLNPRIIYAVTYEEGLEIAKKILFPSRFEVLVKSFKISPDDLRISRTRAGFRAYGAEAAIYSRDELLAAWGMYCQKRGW